MRKSGSAYGDHDKETAPILSTVMAGLVVFGPIVAAVAMWWWG